MPKFFVNGSTGDVNLGYEATGTTPKLEWDASAEKLTVTGTAEISTADINGGSIDGATLGTNSAITEAQIDNINIDGNAITSTDTNGNIALTPDGTGEVDISKVDIDGGTIDSTTIGGTTPAAGTFTGLTIGAGHTIGDSGADNLEIVSGSTENILLKSSGGIISFSDNSGAEYARIDSSGRLLIGTTSAVDKLTVSGDAYVSGGIHLGGTGAANYLDDYEEGTWTAGFVGATIVPTSTTGTYTKIGNLVYISYYGDAATITGASGAARITGLPFSPDYGAAEGYAVINYIHGDALDGGCRGGYPAANGIYFIDDGSITSSSWVNGTKYFMIAGVYRTLA